MPNVILSESQLADALGSLPDWSYRAPNIEAKYAFASFRDALAFIVQVGIQAEVLDHHPEFHNAYNKVAFSFCTHDADNKITEKDIALAKYISEAAARFLSLKPKE